MKQTIKTLAITFGKKVIGALMSALAMVIGEFVLGLFGKGFNKFRVNRAARKNDPIVSDSADVNSEEINFDEIIEEEVNDESDIQEDTED